MSLQNTEVYHAVKAEAHRADDLIRIFNHLFQHSYQTVLEGGGDEPFYQAATATQAARLIFRANYFASALHEVAHWCIAGESRRQLDDFGYWYVASGRSETEQNAFYQVEVKPQALEAIFSKAAGWTFKISCDNIGCPLGEALAFEAEVNAQIRRYFDQGLPSRAEAFRQALCRFYQSTGKGS